MRGSAASRRENEREGQRLGWDHPKLVRELGLLERRHHAGRRETVDHPSGHHDDYANVAALALWAAERARRTQQARSRLDDEDEVFGEEPWRPSGMTDDELGPETEEGKAALQAKLAQLKQRCLAAGHKTEVIANYEREYPDHYVIPYLEELLEEGTLKQRLKRGDLD